MKLNRTLFRLPGLLLLLAVAPAVQAHPGHEMGRGLAAGLAHPFSGWDHILAMFAVGWWAARLYARWILPAIFLGLMSLGAMLGHGLGAVPGADQIVAASVLAFGLLAAAPARLPARFSFGLAGFFALFHGAAHGAEMPLNVAGLAYGAGFVAASALLLAVGAGAGALWQQGAARTPQFAGWVIALAGAVLTVQSFLPGKL